MEVLIVKEMRLENGKVRFGKWSRNREQGERPFALAQGKRVVAGEWKEGMGREFGVGG